MLSEADPNSSVEPWFALSKDRYWSILNEALSEMEPREPEGLVQAELPNCTELIKLLNQDDGLSGTTGADAFLAPPDAKRSAASVVRPAPNLPINGKANRLCAQQVRSLGSQSFPGGAKRKRTTSCKGNSFGPLCKTPRKGSEGVQPRGCVSGKISERGIESSATTQLRRTAAIGRGKDSTKEHDDALRRRRNFVSRDPTSAAPLTTNGEYSLRLSEAFSLRFPDIGRRPSDGRYFQGHHSSVGGTAVVIPSRDLSRSTIVPTAKAKEDRWPPRSGSLPCALSASGQGVKVEPKDEFSTISGKNKKTLEQSILRPPSCNFDGRNNIPPTTTTTTTTATSTGRSDRNDSSAAEVTSRQPPTSGGGVRVDFAIGVAPFVELLKSDDQSAVGRCTPRRTNPETGDTADTTVPPRIRVIPCRIRVAVVEDHFKHSPAAASYSSRPIGRSLVSATRYSSSSDDTDRRGVLLVAPPPGGENALRRDAEGGAPSPSDFLRGTSEQQHRPDKGGRSSKRGSPSLRRERELWAAFDKSVVNSMMQQILDEEDAIKQRLKQTHLKENEEEREREQEQEEDHLCPNGLMAEVDPVKRTKFPPGDASSVPSREANVPDHEITSVEPNTGNVIRRGVNGISNSPASSQEFARDLRIKTKSLSANRNSDIAGSSRSSSSSRHVPDTTATRMPALSPLIGETGTGEKFQNGDTIAFSAQKLGMSRMSFKWKSKMLNRLRKDQITANKWCMSETLSA